MGSLLHDVGKLGVPDSILLKPGKLTDAEWDVMRMHPIYAHQWLSSIPFLEKAISIPYYHHEKWDGSGYPHGLHGEDIPLFARLFAIVDVWDALCSERPYRVAMPEPEVLEYIRNNAGSHFDPALVEIFLKLKNSEKTP
jgi:HD-GYP domain-containing protein (c-di-GMP phosphodiesterase class II)